MAAPENASERDILHSIDVSLSALLAIALDDYVRSHGIDGAKPLTIEKMLTDAGLSQTDAGKLLGKTASAVNQRLKQSPAKKTAKKTGKKAAKKASNKRG